MVLLITQKDFNMFIHCEFSESNVFVTCFSLHQTILYPLSSMYRMFVKPVAVVCWISLKYSKILLVIRYFLMAIRCHYCSNDRTPVFSEDRVESD